jgi:hypothetical protein
VHDTQYLLSNAKTPAVRVGKDISMTLTDICSLSLFFSTRYRPNCPFIFIHANLLIRPSSPKRVYMNTCKIFFFSTVDCTVYRVKFKIESEKGRLLDHWFLWCVKS